MNFLISQLSQGLFKVAYILEDWVGLPDKVSESLYFRRAWRKYLKSGFKANTAALWIHGASVGELENLANFFLNDEYLKEAGYSPEQLILTASSISAKEFLEKLGLKHSFRYAGPLPPEDTQEVRDFLENLNPELLIMSHTDLWPCLMREANSFLTRGCLWLPKNSPKGRILERELLFPLVKMVGLSSPGKITQYTLPSTPIGNPRLDRVNERISQARPEHPLSSKDCSPRANHVNVIIGSCWSEDALIWAEAYESFEASQKEKLFLVAIPHDVGDTHEVAKIQSLIPWARVLPISGVLVESYCGFDLAFVGGGFKSGLHSIVEPALWGLAVACGPLTSAQIESPRLQEQGSLFVMPNAQALKDFMLRFFNPLERQKIQSTALKSRDLLKKDLGATRRLVELLKSWKS